jgi:2-oxoisovalerate dehydrogenase E2 component (dihydrolipoyl transacylase)
MGSYAIKMPDIGEGIAEVEVVAWHVKPGDTVRPDQALADVMTDKAAVEIPSPVAGTVLSLGAQPGEMMAVGAELIRLEVEGAGNVKEGPTASGLSAAPVAPAEPKPASTSGTAAATSRTSATASSAPATTQANAQPAAASKPARSASAPARLPVNAPVHTTGRAAAGPFARMRPPGEKPLASPAVRQRAWDAGVELQFVAGSGPAGRITHEDLAGYIAVRERGGVGALAPRWIERHDEQAIPVIGLRRKIAQKMQEAKRRIPHFSYVEEIDVTELEALRGKLNERHAIDHGKLTVLPLIARAIVLAVQDFPQINARFDDEAGVVTRHGAVHLGIATQTDGGLLVPVLRHAEAKGVWALGAEIVRLAQVARSGKAGREELSGSTITITSLGPLGGIVTTPVINHPEVAIVGVNRIALRPVVRAGAVVARLMMNLSSSFDHRVVDGMEAAQFVQAVRASLETPALLFAEPPQ